MESESIYKSQTSLPCVAVCPPGVAPATAVEAIRVEAVRRQGMNHMKADDIPAKLDDDMPGQALMTAMRKYSK